MIEFHNVDIAFGNFPHAQLAAMLDSGVGNEEIRAKLGAIVGARDVSFTVGKGEICVLMGLSGSGKSTVLRAVNRLNPVTRGQVLIDDNDGQVNMASCNEQTLRRMRMERLATVFQQASLMPWLTVADNAAFGLQLQGLTLESRMQTVREKLAMVKLSDWEDCYPDQLSGGMQQRVGLARAFATDADILLMDEPFSALDPLIRQELQSELLALQRGVQKTVLFVSHDLDEALALGNRIAMMDGGRIVQFGAPETIVLQPATEYIAKFVAHINPLNVLKAHSLMTPLAELPEAGEDSEATEVAPRPKENGARLLSRGCVLHMKAGGIFERIADESRPRLRASVIAPTTPMREVIALLREEQAVLVVTAADQKVQGVIRHQELCKALTPVKKPPGVLH